MTFPARLTVFDRLTVDAQKFRFVTKTKSGYTFENVEKHGVTKFYSFDELRDLLTRSDVLLERDYFTASYQDTKKNVAVDAVGALSAHVSEGVVHKYSYVQAFLQFESSVRVKRTEFSVQRVLGEIEKQVNSNAKAVQRGSVGKRTTQKTAVYDVPCASSILKWVRRYEAAGNSPLGLIPRTYRSGNRKERFSLEALRLMGQCTSAYLTRDRLTMRQVAEMLKARFDEENKVLAKQGLPALGVPSRRKVERTIAKLDPYSTFAHRHGVDAANRKFMLYEMGIDASYPMERIEIDEWRVDLISILAERGALDQLSPEQLAQLPRGRRWLYLAIDCATRCVVGMRLAVNANAEDAIALLADVTRDKTELAVAAGCKTDWAHYGGLKTVATDLGAAFVADSFRTAIFDAFGSPETPTGGLPQLRGRVERIFGTFGTQLMPGLAGRTFSNPKDRGDYPTDEMASITDDALMQMLILYVVDVYHNRPHRGLGGETPNNCWKRIATEKGIVPDVSERTRRRAFGRPMRRTVTGRGVKIFGIDYTCSALRQFHLHSCEKVVDIKLDPNDLGWVMVRVGEGWFPAKALQKCFDGVSYDHWEATGRHLRLKYKNEARLHEKTIAGALDKIAAINTAEQKTFGNLLRTLTPAGLLRGEEDLFLGLSIDPDDPKGFDLPPEDDLFGHVVPLQSKTDDGGASAMFVLETGDSETPSETTDETSDWRFIR